MIDDDTLLLITSDHSPWAGNEIQALLGEKRGNTPLPFTFVTRGSNPFQAIPRDTLSCQLDMLPTLCDGLGLPIPESCMGRSLFGPSPKVRISGRFNQEIIETEQRQFLVNMNELASDPEQLAVQKWLAARAAF